MFRNVYCLLVCIAFWLPAEANDSTRYQLLDTLKAFIQGELQLNIGDHFYAGWNETGSKISYVYVSRTDTLAPPEGVGAFIYVGEDSLKADSISAKYTRDGFHTLHYRTAGTSDAQLNNALWNYPVEAFVFIVIHEAVHVHLKRTKEKIPYDQEEALCDATADHYTPLFLQKNKSQYKAALQQRTVFEKIYRQLVAAENAYYTGQDTSVLFRKTSVAVHRALKSANAFQQDRLNYPVNTAYLMRYHSYAFHYFFFRQLYQSYSTPVTLLSILHDDEMGP